MYAACLSLPSSGLFGINEKLSGDEFVTMFAALTQIAQPVHKESC